MGKEREREKEGERERDTDTYTDKQHVHHQTCSAYSSSSIGSTSKHYGQTRLNWYTTAENNHMTIIM